MASFKVYLRRTAGCFLLWSLFLSLPATAQNPREDLLTRARAALFDFDVAGALTSLHTAVDPTLGPADSVWASAVRLLAQTLIEEGNEPLAGVWLRWAVRTAPAVRIDTSGLMPATQEVYRTALQTVATERSLSDSAIGTSWGWGTAAESDSPGQIQIAVAAEAVAATAEIEGVGTIEEGRSRYTAPGTYRVTIAAGTQDAVTVTREVLPGVTTVLTFDVAAALAEDVERAALGQLVRIAPRQQDDQRCWTGFFAGRDGLLLTGYRWMQEVHDVELRISDGRVISEVLVADYDAELDVAALKLPVAWSDSLTLTGTVADGQDVWALGFPDCTTARVISRQVDTWENRPNGSLLFRDEVGWASQGGPVIDRTGAVVGFTARPLSATPSSRAAALLTAARRNIAGPEALLTIAEAASGATLPRQVVASQPGKKFPWAIAALGAAGAGGLAFLLLGGGEETITPPPPPTTGGIIVTYPNP
jgi:S1-C subfamily serine protease